MEPPVSDHGEREQQQEQELLNKIDELAVLTRNLKFFREYSLLCFTATWLREHPSC